VSLPSYRYVLNEQAVEALLFVDAEEQDFLVSYFRLLGSRPHQEQDYWCIDESGRKNFAATCGPFTVVHWADHAAREMRIVEFRRS
jgi:hypothetical protein